MRLELAVFTLFTKGEIGAAADDGFSSCRGATLTVVFLILHDWPHAVQGDFSS